MYNSGDTLVLRIPIRGRRADFYIEKLKGKRNILSLESDIYFISRREKKMGPFVKEEMDSFVERYNGHIIPKRPQLDLFNDGNMWMF